MSIAEFIQKLLWPLMLAAFEQLDQGFASLLQL